MLPPMFEIMSREDLNFRDVREGLSVGREHRNCWRRDGRRDSNSDCWRDRSNNIVNSRDYTIGRGIDFHGKIPKIVVYAGCLNVKTS